VTGGTLTLTSAQGANIIQEYSGTLASNQIVVVPSTVQIYSFQNSTSGSYNLTFKTAVVGGSTVTVNQNQTALVICDGTNVYSATSSTSNPTSVVLNPGTVSSPTLSFLGNTTTGLYLPATNQIGFAINGSNAMTLSSTGLSVTNTVTALGGITGGTF
jgi:hypothetical protein